MNSVEYMRKKLARRAMFELQELTIDLLEENPEGLTPNQIATALGIIIPSGQSLYGSNRADVAYGILNGLTSTGRVENVNENEKEKKRKKGKAVLTNPPTE